MNKFLIISTAALAMLIIYGFWSNSNVEAQRHRMRTLWKGMSRKEIEAILAKPDAVHKTSTGKGECINLSYTGPVMIVTICHDSAVYAAFYEGKSEITIFE